MTSNSSLIYATFTFVLVVFMALILQIVFRHELKHNLIIRIENFTVGVANVVLGLFTIRYCLRVCRTLQQHANTMQQQRPQSPSPSPSSTPYARIIRVLKTNVSSLCQGLLFLWAWLLPSLYMMWSHQAMIVFLSSEIVVALGTVNYLGHCVQTVRRKLHPSPVHAAKPSRPSSYAMRSAIPHENMKPRPNTQQNFEENLEPEGFFNETTALDYDPLDNQRDYRYGHDVSVLGEEVHHHHHHHHHLHLHSNGKNPQVHELNDYDDVAANALHLAFAQGMSMLNPPAATNERR